MYRQKWRKTLSSGGYTFVESLFQVVVYILFAQFILYFFIWNGQFNETFISTEEANWELFVQDFERYFVNVNEISVEEHEIVLLRANDEKKIVINTISDVLRLQKADKGNVPLLIGISEAKFHYNGNKLTISVEFLNGLKKERDIFVRINKE